MGRQTRGRSAAADRQVEERLAMLLRPGPRRVRLERATPEAAGRDDDIGPGPETEADPPVEEGDNTTAESQRHPGGAPPGAGQPASTGAVRTWLRPRLGGRFERPQLMVIVVMVVIGLALSGWAVLRARPVELPGGPPVTAVTGSDAGAEPTERPTAAPPGATAASSPTVELIKVHVLGAVRRSGVHELPDGSRIEDALKAAGGLTRSGELGDLNLAQPLTDGQQIFIAKTARRTEVREPGDGSGGAADSRSPPGDSTGSQVVNLNTAGQGELDQLPGVGPVTAEKILSWRETNGRFSSVAELQEVDGIGPKTFAELAPLVTI